MLKLESLSRHFGDTIAVDDLTFAGEADEFVVIFGPAGAGKTTTLRLIAGIIEPTRGRITLGETDLAGVAPEHRNMSMVFENYALYSHLSVFENIAFPLRARGYGDDRITSLVEEMAEILQIRDLLERRPGFLSGGQRQRVALGRALVRDADVYLLDEPISHLDAKLRHRMRGELKAICAQKQATVVHVTHDYREAMALSDRMIVLNDGLIMQIGTPEQVFHYPENEFVAGFVGEPPMSFVEVEFFQDGGASELKIVGADHGLGLAFNQAKAWLRENPMPEQFRVGARVSDLEVRVDPGPDHPVPAEVYVIETLGHRNIVTTKLGSSLLQVVCDPELPLAVGQIVWTDLSTANCHVFADGRAVTHPIRVQEQGR